MVIVSSTAQIDQVPDFITKEWMGTALRRAYAHAQSSPDPSTKNGAICFDISGGLVSAACNDFTDGVIPRPDLLDRPKKYAFVEHAERNAIYAATRSGMPPKIMVCPWAACSDCARAIVASGIRILVRHHTEGGHWSEQVRYGDEIMGAGGVVVLTYTDALGDVEILHNGEIVHR